MKSAFVLPGLTVSLVLSTLCYSQEKSIRFFGNGYLTPGKDRIKVPLANSPANVSLDFTIEFWLNCDANENPGNVSIADHGDGWITGNVIIDRDIYGNADPGDYGLSIGSAQGLPVSHRVVAFGINRKSEGVTVQGKTNVADNKWHHVAVTRDGRTGRIVLYVDGSKDGEATGPAGDIAYPLARETAYPQSDPYLVIGAEKHDGGAPYPSYSGSLDELRISGTVRYNGDFSPSAATFREDEATAVLYHFDREDNSIVVDATGNADGILYAGGYPRGPVFTDESPFLSKEPAFIRSLKAQRTSRGIRLSWKFENLSSSYEIQRSTDGKDFISIEEVHSHTCVSCEHDYLDTQPAEGKNIYRIRYVSSGKEKYSPLSYVNTGSTAAGATKANPRP